MTPRGRTDQLGALKAINERTRLTRYQCTKAAVPGILAYVISILENVSRAVIASSMSPRQDLTAHLIVLRAAIATHGASEILVSDSGSIFKAKRA